ncbi:MAG TPA: hypothetical protein VK463_16030 [Desulfomonilaceae bacterium]|nr:hypothetical protein [Desulfomonilaceae bacterium]
MVSRTRILISESCMVGLLVVSGHFFVLTAAAKEPPEAGILEEQLKEAARAQEVQRKQEARFKEELKRRQRVEGAFLKLLATAKVQQEKIRKWEKIRSGALTAQVKKSNQKKRLQMVTTSR